jgi:hypothetical protein
VLHTNMQVWASGPGIGMALPIFNRRHFVESAVVRTIC